MVVARAWGSGERALLFHGYRVSVLEDEGSGEGQGGGCTV